MQPTKRRREEHAAQATITRVTTQLLHDRRAMLRAEMYGGPESGGIDEKKSAQYETVDGDLLTALLRANLDSELPERQRMTDADVLARQFLRYHCAQLSPIV